MAHLLLNKIGVEFVSLGLFGSKNDEKFKGLLIIVSNSLIPVKFALSIALGYYREKIFRKVIIIINILNNKY